MGGEREFRKVREGEPEGRRQRLHRGQGAVVAAIEPNGQREDGCKKGKVELRPHATLKVEDEEAEKV
ncbi:hypothetical protein HPP92_011436 [Vanilla planifolia]|uniref:Uncharacterized protein n=1 Tax=Vanilla planifolia TaxID=51239 RepID=A0A835V0R4_VANPL|nr:hypothetical protein HPP92_011428 [Vanilla planifolia]KAG0480578.1 hypothetical protein HPP92_011436 [Vanilla planifolia]